MNATDAGLPIDMGFIRGLITLLTFAVFIGITWWAYHKENRARFDDDAMLPFREDEDVEPAAGRGEGKA